MPLPTPPTEWAEIDETYGLYWWLDVDWTPLLDGAEDKGDDTDISHAPGRYVNPVEDDEVEAICPGFFYADRTFDGDVITGDANCRTNMRANLAFWRGFIASPRRPASPLRGFVLHDENGDDWGADVKIRRRLGLTPIIDDPEQSPYCFKIAVRVIIPAGELVTVGS